MRAAPAKFLTWISERLKITKGFAADRGFTMSGPILLLVFAILVVSVGIVAGPVRGAVIWTNANTTPADENYHGLGDVGDEATVKAIVQAAFDHWNGLLNNGQPLNVEVFSATIYPDPWDPGFPASAVASIEEAPGGIPTKAIIILDDGDVFYLDGTPKDDYEFRNGFITPFDASNGVNNNRDLFRVVLHELGHALGIARESTYNLPAGHSLNIEDGFDGPTDNTFDLNGVQATFDGDHLDGSVHPNDLMVAGGTAIGNRRQLITDKDLSILETAYGYTKLLPASLDRRSFHVVHDTSGASGQVYIQGTNSGDIIVIHDNGSTLEVEVNKSILGFVRLITESQVSHVLALGYGGADFIDMREIWIDCDLRGGIDGDVVVGGLGNDIVRGEAGDDDLYGGPSADHLTGGDGTNDDGFGGDPVGAGSDGHDGTVENWDEDGPNAPGF